MRLLPPSTAASPSARRSELMISYPDSIFLANTPDPIGSHPGTGFIAGAPQSLLSWLLDNQVVLIEEWEELPVHDRARVEALTTTDDILDAMLQRHMMTSFQVDAVRRGTGTEIIL